MKEHDNFREQKAARYGCTAAYVVGGYAVGGRGQEQAIGKQL